jgi:hypothetical protein
MLLRAVFSGGSAALKKNGCRSGRLLHCERFAAAAVGRRPQDAVGIARSFSITHYTYRNHSQMSSEIIIGLDFALHAVLHSYLDLGHRTLTMINTGMWKGTIPG